MSKTTKKRLSQARTRAVQITLDYIGDWIRGSDAFDGGGPEQEWVK